MTQTELHPFERVVRAYLAAHPSIRHEWHDRTSKWWGDRREIDLLPSREGMPSVWASFWEGQITVGFGDQHTDFETFGRKISEEQLAQEAFSYFLELVSDKGYLPESSSAPSRLHTAVSSHRLRPVDAKFLLRVLPLEPGIRVRLEEFQVGVRELSPADCQELLDLVADRLQLVGFDREYDLTAAGRELEDVIDRLTTG